MNKETAIKAAEWWAEKIKKNEPHSNGDNDPRNMTAMMLADILRDRHNKFTNTNICKFKENLINNLLKEDDCITFGCEYHPDIILFEAAQKAGFTEDVFPYKTFMTIRKDGTIFVREGYGSAEVQI